MPNLEEFIRPYGFSILVGIVSAVILGAVVGIVVAMRQRVTAKREQEAALRVREVATIVEEVRTTTTGSICWFLLGSTALSACAGYYSVETVAQQVGLGLLLIIGMSIFGLGAALGRRRTYTVYQHKVRARSTEHFRERTSGIRSEPQTDPSDQHSTG